MEFLYFLEKIRNPVFDFFFSLITHIGEETFFLVIAILFFWCINKREGYFILMTGLIGTVLNQALKLLCKIPRPWVLNPNFTIVESARAEATGYSFPSGHTQNVAGTFGAVGRYSRRKWVSITCVVIIALVSLSRMYLGVHTPYDVATSLCIAALLIFVLAPMFEREERFHRTMPYIIGVSIVLSLAFALYAFLHGDNGVDAHNLYSARKNAATLLGCLSGLCLVYPLDRFKINFTTDGRWYSQAIKLVLGLGGVLAIKSGLKAPLEWFFGLFMGNSEFLARGVRYFIIVAFAGAVWPLTFNFFSKLRITALENFTEKVKAKFKKN